MPEDDEKRAAEKLKNAGSEQELRAADPQTMRAILDVLMAAEAWADWISSQPEVTTMLPHQRILFHAVMRRRMVEAMRVAGDDDTASGRLRQHPRFPTDGK